MTVYDWRAARDAEKQRATGTPAGNGAIPVATEGATRYALAALEAECAELAVMPPDSGRNPKLNQAAYRMGRHIGAGSIDHHTVRDALERAAQACRLPQHEIDTVLRDNDNGALLQGQTNPRYPAERTPIWDPTGISPSTAPPGSASSAPTRGTTTPGAAASATEATAETERTSWWPRPITEAAEHAQEQPEPTHLVRNDGQRLLYSGKVNGLIGESESGKTWVALLAVSQTIRASERVLYLDFEDSADGIENRMRDLGCGGQLEHLDYANPDEALGIAQAADLGQSLAERGYSLIVVDGVNAAMVLLGYDIDASNKDATLFAQKLLRPLTTTGAAVVTVDHVPKNKEMRGKGGIGAQAKRAMMNGSAIAVEMTKPFGKGLSGEMRLTVDKDRPGRVRGVSREGKGAGVVHLTAGATASVAMHIEAPDLRPADERPAFRPTGYMEKVSRLLEEVDGLSGRAICEALVGRDDTIRAACAALVETGHVRRETRGTAVTHHLVRPYRELGVMKDD